MSSSCASGLACCTAVECEDFWICRGCRQPWMCCCRNLWFYSESTALCCCVQPPSYFYGSRYGRLDLDGNLVDSGPVLPGTVPEYMTKDDFREKEALTSRVVNVDFNQSGTDGRISSNAPDSHSVSSMLNPKPLSDSTNQFGDTSAGASSSSSSSSSTTKKKFSNGGVGSSSSSAVISSSLAPTESIGAEKRSDSKKSSLLSQAHLSSPAMQAWNEAVARTHIVTRRLMYLDPLKLIRAVSMLSDRELFAFLSDLIERDGFPFTRNFIHEPFLAGTKLSECKKQVIRWIRFHTIRDNFHVSQLKARSGLSMPNSMVRPRLCLRMFFASNQHSKIKDTAAVSFDERMTWMSTRASLYPVIVKYEVPKKILSDNLTEQMNEYLESRILSQEPGSFEEMYATTQIVELKKVADKLTSIKRESAAKEKRKKLEQIRKDSKKAGIIKAGPVKDPDTGWEYPPHLNGDHISVSVERGLNLAFFGYALTKFLSPEQKAQLEYDADVPEDGIDDAIGAATSAASTTKGTIINDGENLADDSEESSEDQFGGAILDDDNADEMKGDEPDAGIIPDHSSEKMTATLDAKSTRQSMTSCLPVSEKTADTWREYVRKHKEKVNVFVCEDYLGKSVQRSLSQIERVIRYGASSSLDSADGSPSTIAATAMTTADGSTTGIEAALLVNLPIDLLQYMFGFLSIGDTAKLALVNRQFFELVYRTRFLKHWFQRMRREKMRIFIDPRRIPLAQRDLESREVGSKMQFDISLMVQFYLTLDLQRIQAAERWLCTEVANRGTLELQMVRVMDEEIRQDLSKTKRFLESPSTEWTKVDRQPVSVLMMGKLLCDLDETFPDSMKGFNDTVYQSCKFRLGTSNRDHWMYTAYRVVLRIDAPYNILAHSNSFLITWP